MTYTGGYRGGRGGSLAARGWRIQRWRRCLGYLREAGTVPGAQRLAYERDGFTAHTRLWLVALSKMEDRVDSLVARNRRLAAKPRCGWSWEKHSPMSEHTTHVCKKFVGHAGQYHLCSCGVQVNKPKRSDFPSLT